MGRLPVVLLVIGSASAAADPHTAGGSQPAQPAQPAAQAQQPQQQAQPPTRTPTVAPFLVFDPPAQLAKSLRLEAIRIAGERADADWRYPEPGALFGNEHGIFYMGYFHYQPRSARSAALHAGSIGATLLGEILLSSGSPAAGVGALLTGATLDAAAADVDRDAEARSPR